MGFVDDIVCAKCGRSIEYTKLEPHHTARRVNNKDKTVPVCRECHDWIGRNPGEAKKLDLYDELDNIYRGHIK